MKRYLFFVAQAYAYSILRPLQEEIRRRGGETAWFIEKTSPVCLREDERQLKTIPEVIEYNPLAVFAPGNHVYDFFPGVKVSVFHGYAIQKRQDKVDDHFTIRGWYDIYCSQGESSTPYFKVLEQKYGFFKVYETGWTLADGYFSPYMQQREKNLRPVVLYASTFSKNITSAPVVWKALEKLVKEKPWDWILTLHPKLQDPEVVGKYKALAEENENVVFFDGSDKLEILRKADVLLCDSSSIILEFMFLDKPVVTYRNTHPGDFLLDVRELDEIGPALEKALQRPADLMENIRRYTLFHEPHRDCHCCARVLDAVDDFVANYQGKIKKKPLNLVRKLKMRWKTKYFPFGPYYKASKTK